MNKEVLRAILERHKKWIDFDSGGERADLSDTDLSGENLNGESLIGAGLSRADLSGANMRDINLSFADLRYANLRYANLEESDLKYANLKEADLTQADLRHAVTEQMVGKSVISVQVDTSRPNNTISYWVDLEIWTTGCFQGSLEELREKIEETHKDNTFLRERYHRVIHFILQEADEDNGRNEVSR